MDLQGPGDFVRLVDHNPGVGGEIKAMSTYIKLHATYSLWLPHG